MALSPTQEAQVLALVAQEAALLSLAAEEPAIISNLGATDVTLTDLPVASSLSDADLFLVRQGTTDKSVARSVVLSGLAGYAASGANTDITSLTGLSGNIGFTGTANRIRGDLSNATAANRVMFQTSTVNGSTTLGIIPNGTATTANYASYSNGVDPANSSAMFVGVSGGGTEVRLQSSITGTGTYLPMTLYTGGSERMRIDTGGGIGFGGANYGTAGHVLTSNGAGVSPVWSAISKAMESIDYTLSANALTLKLNPTTLAFRSTTLISGAPTFVSNAAQITTTISSGSTGGTISGQSSDIILLAINNAGTMELAWTNLSGGLNLDETTLINTTAEGGAGAADSSTVIYSTTARTGVAFRVVGVFRSTQTSAGTWAQTPALVQPVGGQALAAMSSLGYGQTWQSVTRTSGTTYYNTTGKPITLVFQNGVSSSSTLTINGVVVTNTSSAVGTYANVTAIIPVGGSYLINDTAGVRNTTSELR